MGKRKTKNNSTMSAPRFKLVGVFTGRTAIAVAFLLPLPMEADKTMVLRGRDELELAR